ncbi:unnamed protein product [Amaranthus hypochondriacus]
MQRNNDNNRNSEISFLVDDIESVLEMNRLLEKENHDLKLEITRLKSQITSLKAHDLERKSLLWKKFQFPIKDDIQQKKIPQTDHKKSVSSPSPPPSPPPPPPPNKSALLVSVSSPPPPPPPLPAKMKLSSKLAVRRVPDVIEFYRYLSKRNAQIIENRGYNVIASSKETNPRNMIGEIENRSSYLSAVKSDVEMQREFINYLIKEVNTAVFKDISEVETFVKWLDGELTCLVDERAVLKHFSQWPERKADALREAACCFKDLKNLECDIVSYKDNPKQPLPQALRRIQALQDRLERLIENIVKVRDGTCKRYKELLIPWDWMLDTGLLGQLKLRSLRLTQEYIKRIIKELSSSRSCNSEDIIHQGARFAYRVHQFAGGFDIDTEKLFEELKQVHHKLYTSL